MKAEVIRRTILLFIASLISLYFFANFQRAAVPNAIFDRLQTDFGLTAGALTGIGAGTVYLSTVKEIDRLFPDSFTKVLGITMLVGSIGASFAGSPFIWAAHRFGWRAAMFGVGVLVVASTLAMLILTGRIERPRIDRGARLFSLRPIIK